MTTIIKDTDVPAWPPTPIDAMGIQTFLPDISPRTIPPPLHNVGHLTFPPSIITLQSTVNVYKIDSGRSVKVRNTGYGTFQKIPRPVSRLGSGVWVSTILFKFSL